MLFACASNRTTETYPARKPVKIKARNNLKSMICAKMFCRTMNCSEGYFRCFVRMRHA